MVWLLTPADLALNRIVLADSTHIVVPLENAVFALPGTVQLTVHFVDPASGDLNFTIENDFIAAPVLFLAQGDIERNRPQA